ncbi:hypothetical protein DL765_009500 [Monosporascus sp. GIB2]|nr:hypothetical protein DL765_009500 [Monosporascus sp. GIB2]
MSSTGPVACRRSCRIHQPAASVAPCEKPKTPSKGPCWSARSYSSSMASRTVATSAAAGGFCRAGDSEAELLPSSLGQVNQLWKGPASANVANKPGPGDLVSMGPSGKKKSKCCSREDSFDRRGAGVDVWR